MNNHRIAHKLIFQARLQSVSPLRIANGAGDRVDLQILRSPAGPYLPGSSLAGVLSARWKAEITEQELLKAGIDFWGTPGDKLRGAKHSTQSHFILHDMPIKNRQATILSIRDGVRISQQYGTVDGNGKYDYELLEPGAEFDMRIEVTVRVDMDLGAMLRILRWVQVTLQDDLRVGGNTTKGFGCLEASEIRCWHFAFPKDAEAWMAFRTTDTVPESLQPVDWATIQLPQNNRADFELEAEFTLQSALMIGAAAEPADDTDKAHLRSNGQPVISGRSLMGALRHRAEKILSTMQIANGDQLLKQLFGIADDPQIANRRSRLITREVQIPHAGQHMKQTRIRVDRFSGAPVDGGLFDSAPIWKKSDGTLKLHWRIVSYENWEAALLLHLLKDLWTQDLAVGGEKNIGRGILKGKKATIRAPKINVQILRQDDFGGISIDHPEQLVHINLDLNHLLSTPNAK